MKAVDREGYVQRYEERLSRFGYSSRTLGWGKPGREEVRFGVLAEPVLALPRSAVLDVGCGFADFYDYLRTRGWEGSYAGLDIVPGLLEVARERHPGLDLREADIADSAEFEPASFDVVVGSGVFNWRLQGQDNREHIEHSVRRMCNLARHAVCVDFLSTNVDYHQQSAWHTDPAWAVELAARLTRRWRIRSDYMAFEFALLLYRDDSHERGVFRGTR